MIAFFYTFAAIFTRIWITMRKFVAKISTPMIVTQTFVIVVTSWRTFSVITTGVRVQLGARIFLKRVDYTHPFASF